MYTLNRENTVLLIVDIQDKLAAAMDDNMLDTVVTNNEILISGFNKMEIPVIESVQYPKGLGDTLSDLKKLLKPKYKIEKQTFSCATDNGFIDFLKNNSIKSVVISGMEAHVCILQTAIDLLNLGYAVHIVADAVISRNDFNWEIGIDYMQKAGAMITVTEIVLFQLLKSSTAPEFKYISEAVK